MCCVVLVRGGMARSRRTRAARPVPKHAQKTRKKRLEMVLDASADADYPPVLRSDSDNRG